MAEILSEANDTSLCTHMEAAAGAADGSAGASTDMSIVMDGFARKTLVQDGQQLAVGDANAQTTAVDVMNADKENQGDDAARGEVEDANPKVISSPMLPARKPCPQPLT